MQGLVETILETLPAEAAIMIVAALPVIEVRGGYSLGCNFGASSFLRHFSFVCGKYDPFSFCVFLR